MSLTDRTLQNLVQGEVNRGARVEYQATDSVTLSTGKAVRHVLHLIVSLLVAPWAIVWAIFEFTGGVRREVIRFDAGGNIVREQVPAGNPLWAKIASLAILAVWALVLFGGIL